jgi:hypothetical protein
MSAPDVKAIFNAALAAEGIADPDAARERIEAALRVHGIHVDESWIARDRRMKVEYAEAEAAKKAAALAQAIPYAGAIRDCQTMVNSSGRGATAYRCQKRARHVVRRDEYGCGKGQHDKMDGRLAVCGTHARDREAIRYHAHWSYEKCAGEPVEPEYQPNA